MQDADRFSIALPQNCHDRVMRVAVVDDDRLAKFRRETELRDKNFFLHFARRAIGIMKIQTDFTDADCFTMQCQVADCRKTLLIAACRVLRMNPDDCENAFVTFRQRNRRVTRGNIYARGDDRVHAGLFRACDHSVEIVRELLVVQMAVRVDHHRILFGREPGKPPHAGSHVRAGNGSSFGNGDVLFGHVRHQQLFESARQHIGVTMHHCHL
jgi:hypothetical protein